MLVKVRLAKGTAAEAQGPLQLPGKSGVTAHLAAFPAIPPWTLLEQQVFHMLWYLDLPCQKEV